MTEELIRQLEATAWCSTIAVALSAASVALSLYVLIRNRGEDS